jgi:diaminohydroxyphosphoribosylaminopyrimidine deaminase/5-amino-6-(5-phosphoribosylamino)uracil reductase
VSDRDAQLMRRCLDLARLAEGKTSPNPLVGSVIVQNKEIVGEGFHPQAGQPHAEVFALQAAGDRAQGSTLYVNLEPCNHFGRTPPCSEAIIQAGIAKVVVGMIDPNPLVAGKGIQRLREAGIQVVFGVEEAACRQLNEAFSHRILHQRPFGILKYAMTLDGKIATTTGHSAWVTGTAARQRVHQVRSRCDAVIVGGNTVRRDNPNLTCHGQSGRNPLRVVMTRSGDLPREANLWNTAIAPTLVFTEIGTNPAIRSHLNDRGVDYLELDRLSPLNVMENLAERGCNSVLWECGGTLAARAIVEGCIQKIMAFVAPKIIGGDSAPSPVGDLFLSEMTQALILQGMTVEMIGEDLLIVGYLADLP